MNIKVAPPGMARQVDGNKLIDRLCDSKVFLDYRPAVSRGVDRGSACHLVRSRSPRALQLRHGCLKLTTEHLAETLGGMDGAHTEANWTEVRVHTQEACVAVDACKPGAPLLFNQYEPTDDCNACRALVSDVEVGAAGSFLSGACSPADSLPPQQHLLMREKDENQKDKARVAGIIDSMCYDLGMRAEYSPKDLEYMTEICEELVDDVGARSIAGTIMLRNRLSRSGMRPTGTLADKVCGEMGGFCEDTSEEGDDADEEL